MGKKKQVGLSGLLALATKLQEAMGGLRALMGGNEELEAAYDGVRLVLNRVIVEILRQYLDEVEVRLDPRQPQVWDDFRAVLEVVYGAVIIRLPVPMLRSTDPELAKKVWRKKMFEDLLRRQAAEAATARLVVEVLPALAGAEIDLPRSYGHARYKVLGGQGEWKASRDAEKLYISFSPEGEPSFPGRFISWEEYPSTLVVAIERLGGYDGPPRPGKSLQQFGRRLGRHYASFYKEALGK